MAERLRASVAGLELVDVVRRRKGWKRQATVWYGQANVSLSTLRRFWQRHTIGSDAFQSICVAVGVDWQQVAEAVRGESTEPEQEEALTLLEDDERIWVGRDRLVNDLLRQLQRPGCRLLLVTGMTGIGKTALVEELCEHLCANFSHQTTIHFDSYEQNSFSQVATYLPGILLGAKDTSGEDMVKAVVTHLVNQSKLVVLDGLEAALQGNEESGWSEFKDPTWGRFFQRLLAADACQSVVLVTSQEFPTALRMVGSRYETVWHGVDLKGLEPEERAQLFEALGVGGSVTPRATIGCVGLGTPTKAIPWP